jgi:hypothetical protein
MTLLIFIRYLLETYKSIRPGVAEPWFTWNAKGSVELGEEGGEIDVDFGVGDGEAVAG